MWPFLLSALLLVPETDRLSARLQIESGNAFIGQGLLVQARHAFSRALDLNPGEDYAVLGLARVSALEGSVPLASYWYGLFIDRLPEDYRGPLELGLLLIEDPDSLERSGSLIRTALALSPSRSDVQMAFAGLLLKEADTTGAMAALEALLEREGSHRRQAGMALATLLANLGDYPAARRILEEPPFPDDPGANLLAARTHIAEGDYLRAADRISRCLTLSPGSSVADSARTLLDSLAEQGLFITD